MKKKTEGLLKNAFSLLKNRLKVALLFIMLLLLTLAYSRYLKAGIFVIIFIIMGGISKFYHRFFKSTLGIDLVFFGTIMTALAYKNQTLSLVVAWVGLIAADTIALKFSHTSIVSLIGLTIISLISGFVSFLPFTVAAMILLIIFEAISILLYLLLGSTYDKIAIFLISHFIFNVILIFMFAESLAGIMV
jgi:hypothetical protein